MTVEEDGIVLAGTETVRLCWLEPDGMQPGGFVPKFVTKTEEEERVVGAACTGCC